MENKRYSVEKTIYRERDGECYIEFSDEECAMLGIEVEDAFDMTIEKSGAIILTKMLTRPDVVDTVKG